MAEEICGHAGCSCKAREDGYCADWCAEHAGEEIPETGAHWCQCGHPECAASAAAQGEAARA